MVFYAIIYRKFPHSADYFVPILKRPTTAVDWSMGMPLPTPDNFLSFDTSELPKRDMLSVGMLFSFALTLLGRAGFEPA